MAWRSNLISTNELQSRISDSSLRIVDCRFDLADPNAGREAYLSAHIPGAVFADLDDDLAAPISPKSGRHSLPDVPTISSTLGRHGIDDSIDVVVYDAGNGAVAARAWWMLRWLGHDQVRLLDGGFEKWVSTNHDVVSGPEEFRPKLFNARPREERIITTAEIEQGLGSVPGLRLIDARDEARYRGEIEPIDSVAGHIPGALNVPYSASLKHDGTWSNAGDLEKLWLRVLGKDKDAQWAVMCGSGVTACHLAISAAEAGFAEPRLYVGSWSEWIREPTRPVGLGED